MKLIRALALDMAKRNTLALAKVAQVRRMPVLPPIF